MADSTTRTGFTRREALMLSSAAGLGVAVAGCAAGDSPNGAAARQSAGTISTPRSAIAKTQYGKVRGYLDDGLFTFKGVPYGQYTSDVNLLLTVQLSTPWEV